MRKSLVLLLFSVIIIPVFATQTAAFSLGGSYLTRSFGTDAIYWNPANLHDTPTYRHEITTMTDYNFSFENNALSVNDYNDYNDKNKPLSESQKDDIISSLNGNLRLQANARLTLFAMSFNPYAVGTGINLAAKAKLSDKYIKLALRGNDYDKVYTFNHANNNGGAMGYVDLSYANGRYYLSDLIRPLKDTSFPEIKVGYTLKFLIGLGVFQTKSWNSTLATNDQNGISLNQTIKAQKATGGYGFSGKIAFAAEPVENLQLALAFDNLVGFIKWTGKTEETTYTVNTDSLYVNNLEDDLFNQDNETVTIDNFETELPPEVQFGAQYDFQLLERKGSVSLDLAKRFSDTVIYSSALEAGIGLEYFALAYLPLRLGFSLPNKDRDLGISYGIGYNTLHNEVDFCVKTVDSLFQADSKGLGISLSYRFRY